MGIFAESRDEDVEAISQFVGVSMAFYSCERASAGATVDFEVTPTPNFDFGFISDLGGRVLTEFEFPTALQRVATLLVLCNSIPPFSLTRRGKLCLDVGARKAFLSRFTCLLVQAALSTMSLEREGRKYSLSFDGFPDVYFCEQFLVYLQWMESYTVVPGGDPQSRAFRTAGEAYRRILAHLVLGCALALASCVREDSSAALLN